MKKRTPEEKQFINDLRAVLKKMPKHLCLIIPNWTGSINVLRKDHFSTFLVGDEWPLEDANDYNALIAEIKTDARWDRGWYEGRTTPRTSN